MPLFGKVPIPSLLALIIIRFRTIGLKIFNAFVKHFVKPLRNIFNLFMDHFVERLTIDAYFLKFIGRPIQSFLGVITGNHYSLVNVSDDDFSIGITACDLFKPAYKTQDYNNPDIHDVFHIYLSKILYEQPDQIIDQCKDWGFREESIKILPYQQIKDLKKYTYCTQAALLHHDKSNTIIVAFRGTEPMDLLQWMTDAATNFQEIKYVFNDDVDNENNEDNIIQIHAGFYAALGLSEFNPSKPIDPNEVTDKSAIFIQLLNHIQNIRRNNTECNISITGHSLGAALASLFSFVLLAYGYESSISGVYTYGQPLVGNRRYAEILNKKLGNRTHRWVNHCDIVTRIPVIPLVSIPLYYPQNSVTSFVSIPSYYPQNSVTSFVSNAWDHTQTPYSDALEAATGTCPKNPYPSYQQYYPSGLRLKIDSNGDLSKESSCDREPILDIKDIINLSHFIYSIRNVFYSLSKITPLRSIFWLLAPVDINDHFPGDYGRKIKKIVKNQKRTIVIE